MHAWKVTDLSQCIYFHIIHTWYLVAWMWHGSNRDVNEVIYQFCRDAAFEGHLEKKKKKEKIIDNWKFQMVIPIFHFSQCHCPKRPGNFHRSRSADSSKFSAFFPLSDKITIGGIFRKIMEISSNFDHPLSFWRYFSHVRREILVNFHNWFYSLYISLIHSY